MFFFQKQTGKLAKYQLSHVFNGLHKRSALSLRGAYMKWYSISFNFPNFHSRCGARRSSSLMRLEVVELLGLLPALLWLLTPKCVTGEQLRLWDRQKSSLKMRPENEKDKMTLAMEVKNDKGNHLSWNPCSLFLPKSPPWQASTWHKTSNFCH